MKAKTRNKSGGVLVLVLAVVVALGCLGSGLLGLGSSAGLEASYAVNDVNAFWAAEAGLERFKAIIRLNSVSLDAMTPNYLGANVLLGTNGNGKASYNVSSQDYPGYDNANPTLPKKYKIRSIGTSGGSQRAVTICAILPSFAGSHISNYEENSQYGGNIYFGTGDVIDGPVFVNDQLNISGTPRFLQRVYSSAANVYYTGGGSAAVFEGGLQLGINFVNAMAGRWFNGSNITTVANMATTGGLSLAGGTNKGNWNIIFTNINNVGNVMFAKVGSTNYQRRTLSSIPNGAIYVSSNAYVQGVVNSRTNITLAAQSAIYITGDLVYASATSPNPWSSNFDPNSVTDMLYLRASNSVQILVQDDVNIHANILVTSDSAKWAGFGSYTNYSRTLSSPAPKINFFGALAQYRRGAVGQGGGKGFSKNYKFDTRFGNTMGMFLPYQFSEWGGP